MRYLFMFLLLTSSLAAIDDPEAAWSSTKEKKFTQPYLLPEDSPILPVLDALFANRVTLDLNTLTDAGFEIISSRPRSFVQVARHSALPGYVFKIYLDSLHEVKDNIPGWKWLVYRCKGAEKIRKLIIKNNLTHVAVPRKWIYQLPEYPLVPPGYDQKPTILIAEEMPILPDDINNAMWQTDLTKEHLKEIYFIISRASSVRPRPDNICFMADGRLALIDTEYSFKSPDLGTIRSFLRPDLLAYWDKLVKKSH
jgi:hypothetical protein